MFKIKKYSFIFSLLFLFLHFSSCVKDPISGKNTLNFFNLKQEANLGDQVLKSQLQEFSTKSVKINTSKNKVEYERLKKILARLAPHTHMPDLPYELYLADSPVVNAWCAPGGKVMVFEGLWDPEKGLVQKGNEAELAAVLGHELAHANARHSTKALSRQITFSMVGAVASSVIAGAGYSEGSDLFSQVFDGGMSLYVPSYSRKNEKEADKIGLFYMAKAGYDPQVAVDLWKRAAAKKGNKEKTSIFASHPASGERAKALELYLPEAKQIYLATLKVH